MPIPPHRQAQQLVCTQCSWRHNVIIKSDVLPPHLPRECPKCGGEVVLKPVSWWRKGFHFLDEIL